jgi:acyl carrier protein
VSEAIVKSKEEIFSELAKLINELFEVPLEDIKLESRFFEDLNLDSIDAIDLIGQVQAMVGERINPEHFKSVLTVSDVVEAASDILSNQNK